MGCSCFIAANIVAAGMRQAEFHVIGMGQAECHAIAAEKLVAGSLSDDNREPTITVHND